MYCITFSNYHIRHRPHSQWASSSSFAFFFFFFFVVVAYCCCTSSSSSSSPLSSSSIASFRCPLQWPSRMLLVLQFRWQESKCRFFFSHGNPDVCSVSAATVQSLPFLLTTVVQHRAQSGDMAAAADQRLRPQPRDMQGAERH